MNRTRAAVFFGASVMVATRGFGQTFQYAIGNSDPDYGLDIKHLPSSVSGPGFVQVGFSYRSLAAGRRDILVSRHTMDGAMLWGHYIGSSETDEAGYTIEPYPDGYVVGFESSSVPGFGIGLTKLDLGGVPLWTRVYAGAAFEDFPKGVAIRRTMNGDILAVGRYVTATGAVTSALIRADSATGAPIFAFYFPLPTLPPISSMRFTDVAELPDTTIVVVGELSFPNPTSPVRPVFARFTSAGAPISWTFYTLSGAELRGDGIDTNLFNTESAMSGRMRVAGSGAPYADSIVWTVDIAGSPTGSFLYPGFVSAFQAVKYVETAGAAPPLGVVASGSMATTVVPGGNATMMFLPTPPGAPFWWKHYGTTVHDEGHGAVAFTTSTGGLGGFALIGATDLPLLSPTDAYFIKTNAAGESGCNEAPFTGGSPLTLQKQNFQTSQVALSSMLSQLPVSSPLTTKLICAKCPPCVGDLNGDGLVEDSDFVIFAGCYDMFFAVGIPCTCADFNQDGIVEDTDFVIFASAYDTFFCD